MKKYPRRRIGEIAEVFTGNTPSKENCEFYGGSIPFVTPAELGNFDPVKDAPTKLTEAGAAQARIIPENAVMVCCIGSLGKVGISGCTLATNQQINSIIFNKDIVHYKYGYHYCKTLKKHLKQIAPSTTIPIINKTKFSNIEIPTPPLDEQKRAAEILDKADRIRIKRLEILKLTEDLLHAIFLEIFRDLELNPHDWPTFQLGELITEGPTNGLYVPATQYGHGTPILRIDGFYEGKILPDYPFKRVNIDQAQIDRFRIRDNSIIINRVNSKEYVGKAALVEQLAETTVFESNMMNFTIDTERAELAFVVHQLGQPYVRRQIATARKDAVNQSSINQQDVKGLQLRLPPLPLQRRFAAIHKKINAMVATRHSDLESTDKLIATLQNRFFQP